MLPVAVSCREYSIADIGGGCCCCSRPMRALVGSEDAPPPDSVLPSPPQGRHCCVHISDFMDSTL